MTSLKSLFDLSGQVALVTGGSRGLGLQIAEALGEFGARVVLASRKQKDLDAAVAHLAAQGIEAAGVATDLSTEDEAERLAEAGLQAFGRLDILVNCAGATWGAPAEDYPVEGWNKVFALNVSGLFFLTKAVARRCFLPQGCGVVLNVASIEGLKGHPPSRVGTIGYNASKGAVINLSRALAAEWGPKGIRVNALAPGYFPTKMTAGLLETGGEEILAGTPLGKLGNADDLKGAALLLTSDAGGHITGQVIVVDGGATVV